MSKRTHNNCGMKMLWNDDIIMTMSTSRWSLMVGLTLKSLHAKKKGRSDILHKQVIIKTFSLRVILEG